MTSAEFAAWMTDYGSQWPFRVRVELGKRIDCHGFDGDRHAFCPNTEERFALFLFDEREPAERFAARDPQRTLLAAWTTTIPSPPPSKNSWLEPAIARSPLASAMP